jgi:hypothetical protein
MEEEDMVRIEDDLDSDDEENKEVLIPQPRNRDFSNLMTEEDGHDSTWKYHQNNIAIGAMYPRKKYRKEAIN